MVSKMCQWYYHKCVNGTMDVSMVPGMCVNGTEKCQWYQRCVNGTTKKRYQNHV